MKHELEPTVGARQTLNPKLDNGVLETRALSIGYTKKSAIAVVQSDLNLTLQFGELVCLIGPNGSGKSTLLRTLSGLQKALDGEVLFSGKNLQQLSQHELALTLAMVLTDRVDIENATVEEIVRTGRQPHTSWWGNMSGTDEQKVREAIESVHLQHKATQNLNELSDGERQRVMIAKALAQDTPVIILDEPTAHLDLPNRVEIMLLLHRLAHTTGKAILLSTHELDMALQAADRIWLIGEGQSVQCGIPEDLVLNGSFNRTFQSDNYVFNTTNGNFSMNYPMAKEIAVTGDKTRMYWTLRALARAGYKVTSDAEKTIKITESGWEIDGKTLETMEALLKELSIP